MKATPTFFLMGWLYTPVCVRLASRHESWSSHSLSGIYLCRVENGRLLHDFCLTICHVPMQEVEQRHRIYVSALHTTPGEGVTWREASVVRSVPVFGREGDPLGDYIKYALEHGFNFIPIDTLVGNLMLELSLVKVLCNLLYTPENSRYFEEFALGRTLPSLTLVVRSFPFSFTSTKIFSDFRSTGHVAMLLSDEKNTAGIVSDVRYLENMIGGAVTTSDGKSLGLLLGNLRKLNGDGDMVIVAPWERLLSLLPELFNVAKPQAAVEEVKVPSSVLPLVLTDDKSPVSWGSCVLLNRYTLVTNHHVVRPYIDSPNFGCHVVLDSGVHMSLLSRDEVIVPYQELDLAFIMLSEENQLRMSSIAPVKMAFSEFVTATEPVYTAGFGLMLDRKNLTPLMSKGHISTKVSLQPFEFSPKKVPCMIIASASCWNGSSGGGIFNARGSFFGLISSNAQVFVPSITGEASSLTEKIPQFCLCIPLELIMECYRVRVDQNWKHAALNEKVGKTWKLEAYQEDTFERELKL